MEVVVQVSVGNELTWRAVQQAVCCMWSAASHTDISSTSQHLLYFWLRTVHLSICL